MDLKKLANQYKDAKFGYSQCFTIKLRKNRNGWIALFKAVNF